MALCPWALIKPGSSACSGRFTNGFGDGNACLLPQWEGSPGSDAHEWQKNTPQNFVLGIRVTIHLGGNKRINGLPLRGRIKLFVHS